LTKPHGATRKRVPEAEEVARIAPILRSSATVHPPSVDWSLPKEPHGGRLRQQPRLLHTQADTVGLFADGHHQLASASAANRERRVAAVGMSFSQLAIRPTLTAVAVASS
jgi:hypothetical protein